MQPKQYAGAKGIARSSSSGNVIRRESQRRLPGIFTFASPRKSAFGKVNHDQFADALLEKRARGMTQRNGIQFPGKLANFETGGFASLDLIEDAVIDMLKRGSDDPGEAVAI